MWKTNESFMDLVSSTWTKPTPFKGMMRLALKLGKLKKNLKSWNITIFGLIQKNLQFLVEKFELGSLHCNNLNPDSEARPSKAKEEYSTMLKCEEC